MFKYDLINKLAVLLVNQEHESKIRFISKVISIILFLSFFYLIQTEASNFILYLSICSLLFYGFILVIGGVWWGGIQHDLDFIPNFLRKKNNTYFNEYVPYIIFTNLSLFISYTLIWFLQSLQKIETNILIAQDLTVIFYVLTMVSLLIVMSRLTLERSIILFLDNAKYTINGLNRFYISNEDGNKKPKEIYEENKEILKKSFKIKTALWSFIAIFMIFIAFANINFEVLNIYNYPNFKMPNFSWEIWDLFIFLLCYLIILAGWSISLSVVYIAFKTLMQD